MGKGGCPSHRRYRNGLLHTKFSLSPPGIYPDCYRHWETILLGAVPVMLDEMRDDPPRVVDVFNSLPSLTVPSAEALTPELLRTTWA